MAQIANQNRQANHALDAANFFLADVRDGLGPYLAIYLLTEQKWDEARIGMVMSIAGLAGVVAQTPAGALIDTTKAKRLVMVTAALVVGRHVRVVRRLCTYPCRDVLRRNLSARRFARYAREPIASRTASRRRRPK